MLSYSAVIAKFDRFVDPLDDSTRYTKVNLIPSNVDDLLNGEMAFDKYSYTYS